MTDREKEIALREARAYIMNFHGYEIFEEEKRKIEQIFIDIASLRNTPNWSGALLELEEIIKVIKTRKL